MSNSKSLSSGGIVDGYLGLLASRPLSTKMVTSAVLDVVSDVFAQKLMGNKEIDFTSSKQQAILGLLFRGPVMHYWFQEVDKLFSGFNPKSPLTVLLKVACEQLIAAPILCVLNVGLTGLMEGKSIEEIKDILRKSFVVMWKNNVKVWSIVGAFQYRFVPERLRVFVGNIVAIFWNAYVILLSKGGDAKAATAVVPKPVA